MKVLLSWLREFAPFDDDADALAHSLSMLGTTVESMEPIGEHLDGHRRGPGGRPAPAPQGRTDPAGGRRHRRRRRPSRSGAARSTWRSATRCRWRTVGTVMPDGREIGRRKILGRVLRRHALLAAGARPRRRPDGILILPEQAEPGHGAGRGARHRGRRALRPRGQPQPARRHVGGRRGPRSGRPGTGSRSTCPIADRRRPGDAGRRARRRSRSSTPTCADASPRRCSAASPSARRRRWWPTG